MNIKILVILVLVAAAILIPTLGFVGPKTSSYAVNNEGTTCMDGVCVENQNQPAGVYNERNDGQQMNNMAIMSGEVTRTNPLIIRTQDGTEYTINEGNNPTITNWFGDKIEMADVSTGDTVWIQGNPQGNEISAQVIVNKSLPHGSAEIMGRVVSIEENRIIVEPNENGRRITVHTNNDTQYFMDGKRASFNDINQNMNIDVLGILNEDNMDARYILVNTNRSN